MIAAAILAFGFVYIHPFEDGNGRIHRYLIHHVLAARGFNPPGVVFPVSAAILERIDEYRRVLESYSQRLLPLVEWEPTPQFNVRVLNDTGDYYRFFDATPHAEFLYACVQRTIEQDLPQRNRFPAPLRSVPAAGRCLHRHAGAADRSSLPLPASKWRPLSNRAREKEFAALTDEEAGTNRGDLQAGLGQGA